MRAYVDHVLAILPFEPAAHRRLGGPALQLCRPSAGRAYRRVAARMPGRRRGGSPIRRWCWRCRAAARAKSAGFSDIFGAAHRRVSRRNAAPIEVVLPTVPHLAARSAAALPTGRSTPRIVVDPAEKWAAFRSARAALAASGTVTLELALAGVPTVAAYRLHIDRGDRCPADPAAVQAAERHSRQSGAGRERRAGISAGGLHAGQARRGACAAVIRHAGAARVRSRHSAGSTASWAIGAAVPSAKAAAIVLDVARRGRSPRRRGDA